MWIKKLIPTIKNNETEFICDKEYPIETTEFPQYEYFYDTNDKIKYTRYYIITSTNKTIKNTLGFKQKQLYYYTSI